MENIFLTIVNYFKKTSETRKYFYVLTSSVFSIFSRLLVICWEDQENDENKTITLFNFLQFFFQITPYYTLGSPILILFIIRWSKRMKIAKMKKLTQHPEPEREIYFQTYNEMWSTTSFNK